MSTTEAIGRIASLTGVQAEGTRGAKRSLMSLRDALGIDAPAVWTNAKLADCLADHLGVAWLPAIHTEKNGVTLSGLNLLLRGALSAHESGTLAPPAKAVPPALSGPEWLAFRPANSKQEAVTRIAALTGAPSERLGPGGKEHKSVLLNLAYAILPDLARAGLTKTGLAAAIAERLKVDWSDDLVSTGETIRLTGLNVVLAGAERRLGLLGANGTDDMPPVTEAKALLEVLWSTFASEERERWDAREKTLWLRDEGTGQHNQMEWPGFYFEARSRQLLSKTFMPKRNPPRARFANTVFDYSLNHVWDLKVHASERHFPRSGRNLAGDSHVVLNDVTAVSECVASQGLGFIVASGQAEMDEDNSFKRWHDELKGKPARVSLSGVSRARKSGFRLTKIEAFWFSGSSAIELAMLNGVLRVAKQGRQQSGAARPDKFQMSLRAARDSALVATTA